MEIFEIIKGTDGDRKCFTIFLGVAEDRLGNNSVAHPGVSQDLNAVIREFFKRCQNGC